VADFYNRIIGHYEVPLDHPGRDRERGRIWRIVADSSNHQSRVIPEFSDSASVDSLVAALDHASLVVRMFATNQLVRRGAPASVAIVERLRRGAGPHVWAHGLWAVERINPSDAMAVLKAAA